MIFAPFFQCCHTGRELDSHWVHMNQGFKGHMRNIVHVHVYILKQTKGSKYIPFYMFQFIALFDLLVFIPMGLANHWYLFLCYYSKMLSMPMYGMTEGRVTKIYKHQIYCMSQWNLNHMCAVTSKTIEKQLIFYYITISLPQIIPKRLYMLYKLFIMD